MLVWRVQDGQGRGPYKPGFSRQWSDGDSGRLNAPWWIELGLPMDAAHDALKAMPRAHYGCAFRSPEQAKAWFSRSELRRLARLGHHLVPVKVDSILFETPTQLVVGSFEPLFARVVTTPAIQREAGL
jgi:hypothetical protein